MVLGVCSPSYLLKDQMHCRPFSSTIFPFIIFFNKHVIIKDKEPELSQMQQIFLLPFLKSFFVLCLYVNGHT